MLNAIRITFLLILGFVLPIQTIAATGGSSHLKAELIQEEETFQAGRPFWVALHLTLQDDWHVYWKNPGDAGMPLKVEWKLPAGFEAGPLQWPFPEKFTVADMVGFGYKGEVILLSQITPATNWNAKESTTLQADVKWLVCSSLTCQPGSSSVSLPLKVAEQSPQPRAEFATIFERARSKIPQTHIEVKTVRKDGVVQLEVPQASSDSHQGTIQGAYFFPEQKNVIDPSSEAVVAQSTADSNLYLVNLKGCDEIGAASKSLKGVLVLHTQKGAKESIQAFDIDSPIEDDGEHGLLSMLDSTGNVPALAVGNSSIGSTPSTVSFEGGLILALFFAFLGGMILNLMPCVLPVMSFKVMSFVKMAGQSRSLTLKHGLMFAFGVVLSFWILASVMLMLRAYGQAVGWGFQLQEPLFVVILASLLFVFALSLFGVFEWGMFFASWAGQTQSDAAQKSSGYLGSFFNGVLATAVATPCTGPFLGSAVGFAVTLPVWQSMMIFTSLGLGMAFPYLLLAAFPSFLRFMPKPGAWMETFKHLMGFLLLATVLWLLWVFSAQTDAFSLICVLAGFFCFSVGAWIYGRGCTPVTARSKQVLAYVFVALFAFAGCKAILFPRADWQQGSTSSSTASRNQWDGWEDFSVARLEQLRLEGKPVFIDFTAKWCLICQANHMVLSTDSVKKQLDGAGVVKMKADWTKNDPVITEALSKFGRNSVPLYVLYGPDKQKEPSILPQVLTADVIIDHLNSAIPSEEIALK